MTNSVEMNIESVVGNLLFCSSFGSRQYFYVKRFDDLDEGVSNCLKLTSKFKKIFGATEVDLQSFDYDSIQIKITFESGLVSSLLAREKISVTLIYEADDINYRRLNFSNIKYVFIPLSNERLLEINKSLDVKAVSGLLRGNQINNIEDINIYSAARAKMSQEELEGIMITFTLSRDFKFLAQEFGLLK